MAAPPWIGLTGGIGAGKSTLLEALAELGAATISADAVVHRLLAGEEIRDLMVERWGERVLGADRGLDRAAMAAIVFADRDELGWIESQLHPRVGAAIAAWRAALPPATRLAVVEVPLLFETGGEAAFDAVVVVVADDAVRAERRRDRGGTSALEGREDRQLSQDEKASRADYVIDNSGDRARLGIAAADLFATLTE